MKRFSLLLAVVFLTGHAPLPAQLEEGAGVMTGEQEELPELIPADPIPWHDSLLELPDWMSRERREIEAKIRPSNHGAGLFPPQVWPLQPEPAQGPLIWDGTRNTAPSAGDTPGSEDVPPTPLAPELMALYTAGKPGQVFVDPQHLMRQRSNAQMESLVRRWLNEQCIFKTTVLVFGAGQQLPADFDPQALRRAWFGESENALLVFYFYRQPERTLTIFGPGTLNVYGGGLLRSVVDAAVEEAGRVDGGAEQFERFCYKMSVRLHWLSRIPLPDLNTAASEEKIAGRHWPKVAAWTALLLAVPAVGAGWIWYRRRRHRVPLEDGVVLLPELEIEPRFGAPHSGGFSSVINFARPRIPT